MILRMYMQNIMKIESTLNQIKRMYNEIEKINNSKKLRNNSLSNQSKLIGKIRYFKYQLNKANI